MRLIHNEEAKSGYVVLHGAANLVDVDPNAVEVIVGSDGLPFPTAMQALACGKVTCHLPWVVIAVRSASDASYMSKAS